MSGWRDVALLELGAVERGRSRHRPRNDPALFGDGMPFFQTGDVKAAVLHMTTATQSYSDFGIAQSRVWAPGTTCITIAANIAETAVLGRRGCFPDSVLGFTPSQQQEDAYFVKYLLDVHRERLASAARGTTQDNLSLEKLLAQKFSVPGRDARRRIVEIFRAIDELIENNAQRINILRATIGHIFNEWFVNLRYPGHEPAGPVLKSGETLPDDWKVLTLTDSAHPFRLAKPKIHRYDDNKRYLATADCTDFHLLNGGVSLTFANLPSRAQLQPSADTVFFGRMAGYRKVLAYPEGSDEIATQVLSSGFACIECDPGWFSFVLASVLTDSFEGTKSRFATGATQVSLTDAGAKRIPWVTPTPELARLFERAARPQLLEALTLRRQAEVLTEVRALLLPRILTGRIGVSPMQLDALIDRSSA